MTLDGRLLEGLRVVEMASYVAAPLGGLTLSQLGADVIRIDPPGGATDRRRWPLADNGESLFWAGLNKGKKSVVLDLRSPEGRDIAKQIVVESGPEGGILLSNRRDFEHEVMHTARPDLIHVQVTGHHDNHPGVDYTVNAAVGYPLVTGPQDHSCPVNHVLPAWDVACGLYVATAILASDRNRSRTGRGECTSVALYDVALATISNLGILAEAQLGGAERQAMGNYLYGTFARDFKTSDGRYVMIAAITERHWSDLAASTGLTQTFETLEAALECDFSQEGDRFRHRHLIGALLEPWFAARTMSEIRDSLSHSSTLWSPYRSFRDLVTTDVKELIANPMISQVHHPGVGDYWSAASPIQTLATSGGNGAQTAPRLGADTRDVLSQLLGLTDSAIDELVQRGVAYLG